MDRRELVERARSGDHDAFDVLARATVARLDAAARLILRDSEWAKDAVQEAYLSAWRDLPTLRDPDRFQAWLERLLGNACRNQLRRRRRRAVEVEWAPSMEPAGPDAYASGADRDELDRGFERLEAHHRAVLVLHYYVGLPLPDTARALGIPLGTAQSRLHRALRAMRLAITSDNDARGTITEGRIA